MTKVNFKLSCLLLFAIVISSFIACGSSISEVKPIIINTEMKKLTLVLPFYTDYTKTFSSQDLYDELSEYFGNELELYLNKTEGFEAVQLMKLEGSLPFNKYTVTENFENIEKGLKKFSSENNYENVIFPFYNIYLTNESTETYKIYSIDIKIMNYNVEADMITYEQSNNNAIGIDTSLMEGMKSIMDNEQTSTIDEESINDNKEQKIIFEIKNSIKNLMIQVVNNYTIEIYDLAVEEPSEDNTTENNDNNTTINNNNINEDIINDDNEITTN